MFPTVGTFPVVRGSSGYYDNEGTPETIQVYNDRELLEDLGVPDLALLDFAQVSLWFVVDGNERFYSLVKVQPVIHFRNKTESESPWV